MIIDLRDIFENIGSSRDISCSFDMSAFEIGGIRPLKKPVSFSGSIINRAGVVILRGSVSAVYDAPCDRCGMDASENIEFDIEYTLVTLLESEEEKDGFIVLPDFKLNIEDVITTDVILSLPTKHLCKADCRGICSGCGANLNTGDCSCQKEESAFGSALKKFLKE